MKQFQQIRTVLLLGGCVAVLLPGSVAGRAQAPGSATTAPVASAARQGTILGTGDTLSIDVSDMPEVSTKSVKINADGQIDLGLIGSVQAAGLDVPQLRAAVASRAAKYVTNPQVTINLVANSSRFVSVVGEVNTPGLHPLDGPRNVIEMISAAGGVKADAGPRVVLTREARNGSLPTVPGAERTATDSSTRLVLPLNDLLSSTSPAGNIAMLPGDVVSVPKEQLVYVVGDVRKAGGFPMASQETVSVLQALSLAEGSNLNASLKYAKILRPVPGSSTPSEVPINLDAILAGKAPNQPLFANDILFVPKSAAKTGVKRATEIMLQVATGIAIYR